jgi:hypothetical protein
MLRRVSSRGLFNVVSLKCKVIRKQRFTNYGKCILTTAITDGSGGIIRYFVQDVHEVGTNTDKA